MGPTPPTLRFVGYEESRSLPNIVVDGAPNANTVLTLSHWPGIVQPEGLGDDLSAQMAFHYLGRHLDTPPEHPPAEVVTNNHFDQDGLVSVHALVDPDVSLRHRALLIDVAAAGDFGTYRFRDAARASMTVAAYADPDQSPLGDQLGALNPAERCRRLYEETLPLLVSLATHPERFRALWADEDAWLEADEAALATGAVGITEYPEVDLAVVTVPTGRPRSGGRPTGTDYLDEIHPFALNNATDRVRILVVHGRRYRFLDRYETWVQYHSRPVSPRVDMTGLAEQLTAAETGSIHWSAEPPSATTPAMGHGDESSLDPDTVLGALRHYLQTAPAAWNPYPDPSRRNR